MKTTTPVRLSLGALGLAVSLAIGADPQAPPARSPNSGDILIPLLFTHGVACGDPGPDSAVLWTRVNRETLVRVEVSVDPSFHGRVRRGQERASAERDLTVRIPVDDLEPATDYYYRFRSGNAVSETGRFRTAPAPQTAASVRFGWSSDFDGSPYPPINQFETLDRAREDGVEFFVYDGDNVYADNPPSCGADLGCIRGRYKKNREYPALRGLLAAAGSFAVWDDHEVADDFDAGADPDAVTAGREAFEEYMPQRTRREDVGFYRRIRWGRELELFLLDERSFRSSEAGAACQGDLLPAAPPDVRLLAGLPPDAPAGCVDALGDSSRTMLGGAQMLRLQRDLIASNATWKVIVNQVPIAELFGVPYDRWEGYAASRRELLGFLRDWSVRNVVFLTGDLHANMIVDVRPDTFLDPEPVAREIIAGPVAEHTLFEELVGLLGSEDGANGFLGLVTAVAAPECFEANTYAYGLVEVDAETHRLTVILKDGNGAAICGTTLQAQ